MSRKSIRAVVGFRCAKVCGRHKRHNSRRSLKRSGKSGRNGLYRLSGENGSSLGKVENTAAHGLTFWILETIRYHNGYANGYASRLHYISDWVISNTHRGYIKDVTDRIPQSDVQIKTLDFMSRNRSKYPALSDSATFEGIKNMEVGYRSHRFPYIKSARLSSKPIINALKEVT